MARLMILLAVPVLFASASFGFASDSTDIADAVVSLPAEIPSLSEVLRTKLQSIKNVQFDKGRCELIRYQISESRFYPLVGRARLAEARFKVTVWSGNRSEVHLVDETRLVRDP